MKFGYFLLCFILCAANSDAQNWNIVAVSTAPEPVSNNAVCEGFSTEGSFIYSFGGIDSTLHSSGIHLKSWRMNTQTLAWQVLPDLPDTLGKIAASADRVHRFDIAANQFITDGAPIPVPIDDHVQAVYRDSLICVVTGWSNTGNVANVQIYDTYLNTWQVGTSVPGNNFYKCFGASGEILGDTIYYFGGAAGFSFGARSELRKGAIHPNDPTEITWSYSDPDPSVKGYRTAACLTDETVHWLGGSSVSYNYDGIAYNGSGVVQPAQREIFLHPNSGVWGTETHSELPMDLRGIANISSTEKYIIGGIAQNRQVSASVLKLTYTGSLSVEGAVAENGPFVYPNPTNGMVHLQHEGRFELLDIHGRTILSQNGVSNASVDLSHLPNGVYMVRLVTRNSTFLQRIVIQK